MLISRLQQFPEQQQQQAVGLQDKTFSWLSGFRGSGYGTMSTRRPNKRERSRWEDAAPRGSLTATVQLAYAEDARHDPQLTACQRCDAVADHYLAALERERIMPENVCCSADLLELVSQICQMVLEHAFYQEDSWWFHPLAKALWDLAKQLKDESNGSDNHVVTTLKPVSVLVAEGGKEEDRSDEQEAYRRAIRITVYHCRAHVYQRHQELERAAVYFRKCVAVRQPSSESSLSVSFPAVRLLRESAKVSLANLTEQQNDQEITARRRGSISSNESTASTCAHCGKEKRAMPVCAKCRAKSYCSNRCLLADKPIHDNQCHRLQLRSH